MYAASLVSLRGHAVLVGPTVPLSSCERASRSDDETAGAFPVNAVSFLFLFCSQGMLEPTKEPVKPVSAAEMIASIAQAPPAAAENASCPSDTVQVRLPVCGSPLPSGSPLSL